MISHRKTAIIVGVLFITGTVAGMLSYVFLLPVLNAPDYLISVSANENQVIVGALFTLIMGVALAMVPVMLFPIFKKHNEALALGYVVFRALEFVTGIAGAISTLLLIPLSQEYVQAGAPDASNFQALGTLLLEAYYYSRIMMVIVFFVGALMFYYILYQSKLLPQFISVWGLIGVTLHLAEILLELFGLLPPFSVLTFVLALPIAVNEMFLAVWLIVKGFNSSAIASADS